MAKPKKTDGQYEVKEKMDVIYYCVKGQYTFQLPEYERDAFGEIIEENGKKKKLYTTDADGNNKIPVLTKYQFERLPVRDLHSGKTSAIVFLGRFIVRKDDDRYDDLIKAIEAARKNAMNGVKTEEEYKSEHNPEAFAFEKEKVALSGENSELRDENAELRKKLEAAGITI